MKWIAHALKKNKDIIRTRWPWRGIHKDIGAWDRGATREFEELALKEEAFNTNIKAYQYTEQR